MDSQNQTSQRPQRLEINIQLSPLSPLSRPVSPLSFNNPSLTDLELVPTPPPKPAPVFKRIVPIESDHQISFTEAQSHVQSVKMEKRRRDWKCLTLWLVLAIVALVVLIGVGSVLAGSVISQGQSDQGSTPFPASVLTSTKSTSGKSETVPIAAVNFSSRKSTFPPILALSTTFNTIPTSVKRTAVFESSYAPTSGTLDFASPSTMTTVPSLSNKSWLPVGVQL